MFSKSLYASRRHQEVFFRDGTKCRPDHPQASCTKCSHCSKSIALKSSGNPACTTKEIAHDPRSPTRLTAYRHPGSDSEPCCSAKARNRSQRTRSQSAGQCSGEGGQDCVIAAFCNEVVTASENPSGSLRDVLIRRQCGASRERGRRRTLSGQDARAAGPRRVACAAACAATEARLIRP
jgi:hypothetical protein